MPEEEFIQAVNQAGAAIIGQTRDIAPLDKKLYALRDVTATVDSLPLIVSSIMGKKLAADDDCIVLDVKTGSGSFMKTLEDSKRLAEAMVNIGKRAGKKMMAVITDMDRPLGYAVGNALEVIEAADILKNQGPTDLRELCLVLSSAILYLAEKGESMAECRKLAEESVRSGAALRKFEEIVQVQGGDPTYLRNPALFGKAPYEKEICAEKSGWITHMNTENIGKVSLLLGAGRNTLTDVIDPLAGLTLLKKTGDYVQEGEPVARLYTSDPARFSTAEEVYQSSCEIGTAPPEEVPLVYKIIT